MPSSLLPATATGFSANFGAASFCLDSHRSEKWAQEGPKYGPERPWNPQNLAWQAAFTVFLCFRPLISDSLQNSGLLASALTPTKAKKRAQEGATCGPRCQGRRLKLEGWHLILCKIPWGEVLVHRSPVRKYFSSSPWAAQGAKFEG